MMVRKDVVHFSFRTWIFWWWLHNNTRSRHYSMTLHATDSMAQQAITCNGTAHHTTPRHNHTIIGTDVIIIGLILYLRIMNKTYHIAIVAQPLHAMQGPAIACHSAVLHSTASHAKSRHNKTLLHSTPIHARTCHCLPFRSTTQRNHSNKSTVSEPTTSDLTILRANLILWGQHAKSSAVHRTSLERQRY